MSTRDLHTRTYECGVEAEDPDCYATGRYFPVKLGDVFKRGRYRVIHKLGWGGFATVWLARDVEKESNVALKITNIDLNSREHRILCHLETSTVARKNASHPGRDAVVHLLDEFDLGMTHKCLVLDVLGSDVQARTGTEKCRRLSKASARSVARRVALGLDYLWKCGVAHGDLYTRNVLFTAPTMAALSETQIISHLGTPQIGQVKRLDGLRCEAHIPPYLVRPSSVRGADAEVRIVDFGNAFFHDGPPAQLSTPWHVRAPEALFNQPVDKHVDMWAMGCLLFEIITGRTLVDSFLADKLSVISGLETILGSPPAEWSDGLDSASRNAVAEKHVRGMPFDRYFKLNYDHDDSQLLGDEEEEEIPVEEYEKPKQEFSDRELDVLCQIIRRLLSYEPASRGTAEDLVSALQGIEDS